MIDKRLLKDVVRDEPKARQRVLAKSKQKRELHRNGLPEWVFDFDVNTTIRATSTNVAKSSKPSS